ncbi:MAG: hypothetical protein OXE42_12815 [Gammaproteobacteria bacterium]|nr:hypothetical protein [Gammaproteobacteria bacterium]
MVKTKSTDPAREAEFNAWYDDIDIPDVLAVPGFMRARRAVHKSFMELPELDLSEDEGKYIALYGIETADIDKTIIDLYVGARKMVARGRITELLKVTEANYYRKLTGYPPATVTWREVNIRKRLLATSPPADGRRYVYIQKIICCADGNDYKRLLEWLKDSYIPGVMEYRAITGVHAYELYRIMEVVALEPGEIPHLLLVHELTTDVIQRTVLELSSLAYELVQAGNMEELFVEGNDSAVYRLMSDVKPD